MNKIEIENKLNELKEKNCTSFWIVLKNGRCQGGYINEIINDSNNESIHLKQKEIYYTAFYSEIANIIIIY